jgi:hypothetical protein
MEVTNISQLDRDSYKTQNYKSQDESLLNELIINKEFGDTNDNIEIHIISPEGEVLNSIYDFRNYKVENTVDNSSLYNQITLDPKSDLELFNYFNGQYDVNYNILRNLFLSSFSQRFFIKDISSDRTELRISSNEISYEDLGQSYLDFISIRNSRNFYSDFLLNFGDNTLLIAVNVAFDNVNTTLPSLYIKLYEPLPSSFTLNSTLWVVEQISEPYSFRVNTEFIAEDISSTLPLRGPNINVELNEQVNLITPYLSLSNLLDNNLTSSFQQLQSLLEEKSIDINIDYSNFTNFIHFSSAVERLENFKYKLNEIQILENDIINLNNITNSPIIGVNINKLQEKINNIIKNFDGYEYHLYYESGSDSWPKTNSTKPYINSSINSIESLTWFGSTNYTSQYYGGKILEADNYDINNKDYIWNNLPEYIKLDSQNSNLELFVSMLGQHYDYIWTYIKDITNLQIADNRLNFGISKDLVADTLRNFGIKLYTNSRNTEDIYTSLLGITPTGNTLPSTGSYLIDTYVTASQDTIPSNDIVKETYKRIYHNLPYLLKTRGTRTGLRALINCFGIPETILRVNEFGGLNKDSNEINNIYEKFNYSLSNTNLTIPFYPSYQQFLNTGFGDINPDTLEFRFKLDSNNILPTQSILESDNDTKIIKVEYITGSNANINFGLSNGTNYIYSPSIELPLYNDGWWNLNLTREPNSLRSGDVGLNQTYTLTIGNKDSNGVSYLQSCSISITGSTQSQYNSAWTDTDQLFPGSQQNTQYPFSGSIQEFRYWIGSIPIENFKDHIENPLSISYLNNTGSYDNLIFRLPLGSELNNILSSTLSSVHPSNTSSFYQGGITSSEATLSGNINYDINIEQYLINSPNIGALTEVNDKIKLNEHKTIPGNVLTPYISVQKPNDIRPTNDLNVVEISISPQDSINEDIIAQLGQFNIDEYIGDPRLASLKTYPKLDELRTFYFQKYSKSQNIFNIIKLLSYFDNSLFKMIKDFVPAKTNLSTGLVIKPHILERNKQPRYEPILEFNEYKGEIDTAFITGSNGLDREYNTNNITKTSFISGSIFKLNTDKRELFTGELGGTVLTVHSQSLENIKYELNNLPLSSSQDIIDNFSRLPINPTLNNIINPVLNSKNLNLDYSTNPTIPVNIDFIKDIYINGFSINNYPFLFSETQLSNYTLKRHTNLRYEGSKLIGNKYNIFTSGDISFGNEPVINNNTTRFVYFNEIYQPLSPVSGNIGGVPTISFPGRVNADIKYLIDSSSNVIELTQANKNLFDIQSIYNSTLANVSLFDINKPSKQKILDGFKPIYAGGYRYEPILQNYQSLRLNNNIEPNFLTFELENPIPIENPDSQVTQSLNSGAITVSTPTLVNSPIIISPSGPQSNLNINLSSALRFNVVRNSLANFNGEIRQRVQGSFTVSFKIGGSNEPVQLFRNTLYGGTRFDIFDTSGNRLPMISAPVGNPPTLTSIGNDNIRSIIVPVGKTVIADGRGSNGPTAAPPIKTLIGPTQFSGGINCNSQTAPFCGKGGFNPNDGLDGIRIQLNNTSLTIPTSNITNPFGTTTITYTDNSGQSINPENGTYIIENELNVTITYNYDGVIVLPANINNTTVNLRTLSNIEGVVGFIFGFSKTNLSPRIRFSNTPTSQFLGFTSLTPYFLTGAPSTIYLNNINASASLGLSGGADFWYFERGNSVESGSVFTYMTASYDLSKIYYDYIVKGNNLLQLLPTFSINHPVEPLQANEEYFTPKKGDLIRFFNHESETFPIDPQFEREIINIYPPLIDDIGSGSNGTGSYENRLVFEVSGDNIPNQACINNNEITGSNIGKIKNFIFLSKIPDETNIVLISNKKQGVSSDGIILAETINDGLKEEAGNIVKSLKSQNLI